MFLSYYQLVMHKELKLKVRKMLLNFAMRKWKNISIPNGREPIYTLPQLEAFRDMSVIYINTMGKEEGIKAMILM